MRFGVGVFATQDDVNPVTLDGDTLAPASGVAFAIAIKAGSFINFAISTVTVN